MKVQPINLKKETYLFQARKVVYEAIKELQALIHEHGVEGNFTDEKCLWMKDSSYSVELENGRNLYEIAHNQLIDNSGIMFDFYVIETEELLKMIDYLIKIYSK